MTVAVGLGLMEFPFAGAGDYWRWVDLCEAGGVDSLWQTDRLVSRQPILECLTAVAALADREFTDMVLRHNETWRGWLTEQIRALGLRVDDSVGNFVLIHFPDAAGKRSSDADKFLMERGVILRGCGSYGLPQCLRMTVGSEEANRAAVSALSAFMASR